ncbi:TRAP transporter substrate-binding protein [Limnohabitans sp. B9-3]|uniref:TRAP transporter substrate-binding protein n=1 Tax=Limnohabitans sp. B9-3 TaxID=1100707 RepID=UPI000C1F53AF|nr:TRAP transporter substrate-binding protein [Limnohabitans sp. B9-3]PIT77479.1 C4-dicarboxylate ABC transporter [Limnohabitans sp. B9-3]
MTHVFKRAAIAAAILSAGIAAHAETITLKVHHFLGPTSIQHTKMLRTWCDNIARDSKDRLRCQIYPAMQLGGTPPQLFDQARDGVADVVWTLPGYTAGRFPKMEAFELPFMMTNAEATSRATWDYYEKFAKDEFKDVKVLAMHVHGPGNIFTAKKQIKTMADMKGLKLRGPTRLTTKLLASMGATPVGMPVPAVPDALSKGVIDGAVIPYEVAQTLKIEELARYTAETERSENALYTTVFVVPMNKAKYESLPADLKKVIDKNSGRELSAFLGKTQADNDVPGKAKMVAGGHTITVIPKSELDNWKRASASLSNEWIADMEKKGINGAELVHEAQGLIAKYTK